MSRLQTKGYAMALGALLAGGLMAGCGRGPVAAATAGPRAMPVQVQDVSLEAVPSTETYVSTIKGRRSATLSPQVDGDITKIYVKSGERVKAGQILMEIDPLKQLATVQSQQGTEQQQKAMYEYNKVDVARQEALYKAGIISLQAYQQAQQSYANAKGAMDSAAALTHTQKEQLAYYQIRAPFAGTVGDIPVHVGDYVTPAGIPTPVLTTLDEDTDLEAYIYVPTERSAEVKMGLPVELLDTNGTVLARTKIDFISPQVDNTVQGILVKAAVPKASERLRNGQIVNARITWDTQQKPTVPVLAVTRVGGQTFVYLAAQQGTGYVVKQVAVDVGEPVGNAYPVLSGLHMGDRVILSGIQLLQPGMPVMPVPGGPPAAQGRSAS